MNDPVKKLGTDLPHVWDVDGKPRGVRHELIQDGDMIVVSESWTIEGKPYHTDQIKLPIDQAVHILLNMTPDERRQFGVERTTVPQRPESEDDGA